ncbi:MAG: hypothetical protein ACN4GW_01515 [Desulforhopalus sp.]
MTSRVGNPVPIPEQLVADAEFGERYKAFPTRRLKKLFLGNSINEF